MVEMNVTIEVDDILNRPFLNRTPEERFRIIAEGKPRPVLNMASAVTVKNENICGELYVHQFDLEMYNDVEWLTGCEKRHSFFCWPCLLFMPPGGPWNTSGISDIIHYSEAMPEHQQTSEHMQAMSKLQNMMAQLQLKVKMSILDVGQHNEMVERNRAILKRMIDVVCNLLMREQPFQKRINGCQLNPESVVKNLQLLRIYDGTDCIEDAINLIRTSPNIVNDLVDAISKGIKMAIAKEIPASTYVSIILSDHSKTAEKSQISIILRYIKAGKVCERFVGFVNMGDRKSVSVVYEHISNVICEFTLTERALALALDGGIVDVLELYHKMKARYPFILFVPWYGHGLEYVLQQSLANIKQCDIFFKAMNEMKNIFPKKSKKFQLLNDFITTKLEYPINKTWFVKSQFILVVHKHRRHFVQFFETVLQNTITWEPEDLTKVLGFKLILEKFDTVFLLEIFSMVFERTATLSKILRSSSSERAFSYKDVVILQRDLSRLRDSGFEALWAKTESNMQCKADTESTYSKKLKINSPTKYREFTKYRQLHLAIIDRILHELEARFQSVGHFSFCQLLSGDELGYIPNSSAMLNSLKRSLHGAFFNEQEIRNELNVLLTKTVSFGKCLYDAYDFLVEAKLKDSFQCVYKLAEFILTLPIKPPTKESGSTKFKEVRSWSYVPEVAGSQSGDVSIPCAEVDFLLSLKKSSLFHREIAALFYELNKTFELNNR